MNSMVRATDGNHADASRDRLQLWLYVTIAILLIPLAVTIFLSVNDSDFDAVAPLDRNCDLHQGPCRSVFTNGNTLSLSITPRPIQALKQLHIQVRTQGIDAQSVKVDFRGVNMNMGYNRPQLKAISPGHFEGTWVLASCGLERMVWEATVIIESAGKKLAAPFPLETARR